MNNAAKQYQKKNKLMEINLNKLGRDLNNGDDDRDHLDRLFDRG